MDIKNNNEIILSIGMIVKDESAVLRRCLDSLQPIMEAIPCQLIITDTGSTDNTIEIAREYTAEVYSFEWCDDFSAARNYGIEKAKGKWFLFVDADEWFGNTAEIIEFFKSGSYQNYDSAAYKLHSYVKMKDAEEYLDNLVIRFKDMSQGLKFKNRIHETLPRGLHEKVFRESYACHSGYAIDNSNEHKQKKAKRNIELLEKEIAESPEQPSLYWYMAQQYPIYYKTEEHFKYITQAYETVKGYKDYIYYAPIIRNLAICLYQREEKEKAAELIKDYFKLHKQDTFSVDLDLALQMVIICIDKEAYSQAYPWVEKYYAAYKRISQGEISNSEFICDPMCYTVSHFQKCVLLEAFCSFKLDRIDEAYRLVQDINAADFIIEDFKMCIPNMIQISVAANGYDYIAVLYSQIVSKGKKEQLKFLEQAIEKSLKESKERRVRTCEAFGKSFGDKEEVTDYQRLQRVRKMLLSNDKNDPSGIQGMNYLLKRDTALADDYAEVLLAALWKGIPIGNALKFIETEEFGQFTIAVSEYIRQMEAAVKSLVKRYLGELQEKTTLKEKFFLLCLCEHILLKKSEVEEQDECPDRTELFEDYIRLGEQYITRLYNPDILAENQISILTRNYRFFYYGGLALQVRKTDFKRYAEFIKRAVEQCPFFAALVQNSLDRWEEKQRSATSADSHQKLEFMTYAHMVKEKIAELIQQGMRDQAAELINSYEKINPADVDGLILLHSLMDNEVDLNLRS